MAKGSFRCGRCSRTFSMAAHLARHQSAAHGMGGKRGGRPRKAGRRGPGRPAGRRGRGRPRGAARARMAAGGSGEVASRIVTEMTMYRDQLVAQRDSIDSQLAGIENAMTALGSRPIIPGRPRSAGRRRPGRPVGRRGRGRGRGPGRPRGSGGRPGSLKPMVVQVLQQSAGPMSPQEIADAVVRAGYKTKGSNLTKAVSNALPDIRGVKKVGRGQYAA